MLAGVVEIVDAGSEFDETPADRQTHFGGIAGNAVGWLQRCDQCRVRHSWRSRCQLRVFGGDVVHAQLVAHTLRQERVADRQRIGRRERSCRRQVGNDLGLVVQQFSIGLDIFVDREMPQRRDLGALQRGLVEVGRVEVVLVTRHCVSEQTSRCVNDAGTAARNADEIGWHGRG